MVVGSQIESEGEFYFLSAHLSVQRGVSVPKLGPFRVGVNIISLGTFQDMSKYVS